MLDIPNTWQSLNEFHKWYTENNYPIRVPENVTIFPIDGSYGCCIFRQDVYQVEIYLAKPNLIVPRHVHPFDQKIIFLGGHMSGTRGVGDTRYPPRATGGKITENSSKELPHKESNLAGAVLPAGHWHEIQAFDQGFVFLNLQKWPSKEAMTSAVIKYNGEPINQDHTDLMKKHS